MKQIIYTLSLIILLGACTDEKYTDPLSSNGSRPGELVPVELKLNIQSVQSPLSSGTKTSGKTVTSTQVCKGIEISMEKTPVTRAAYENEITNFWVLQFYGTDLTSTLALKQFHEGNSVKEVLLHTSLGVKSRIIVIANAARSTFDNSVLQLDQTTLGQFNDMGISSGSLGFPQFNDPVTGVTRTVFVGSTDLLVTTGKQADIMLYRTIARMNVKLDMSQAMIDKGYTVWTSQFMHIPDKSFYHSIGRTPAFPGETVGYSNYNPKTITSFPTTIDNVYLPVNLHHPVPFTTEERRAINAPANGTFLQLVGVQMAGSVISRSVVYQIHLGSNFTDDYSVSPNYSYTYNIRITGESDDDSRVIKFIPGYFGGSLKMYTAAGAVTVNQTKADTWRYEKKIEVYMSDVKAGVQWRSSGTMPADLNSLMDGRQNTWDLRTDADRYPAIKGCLDLNPALPNIESMVWYMPSYGQSLSIYVAGSNTLRSLPNTYYWSSTADNGNAWGTQVWTGESSPQESAASYNLRCVKDLNPNDVVQ